MRGADEAAVTRIGVEQARRAGLTDEQISLLYGRAAVVADAQGPRPLYVRRDALNAEEILAHFADQGLDGLVPPTEVHATVCYSRTPVDWLAIGEAYGWGQGDDGRLIVPPGGPRYLDRLGDGGVIAQMFASSQLSHRHHEMRERGTSWDYEEYMPHLTIVADAPAEIDVAQYEPWRGQIILGPEIFEGIE